LSQEDRMHLVEMLEKVAKINVDLDNQLATLSHSTDKTINRQLFSGLPHEIAQELLVYKLRSLNIKDYDKQTVGRLNMAIKAGQSNLRHPIKRESYLMLDSEMATFVTP
jgi:hypothetical protein